MARRPLAVSLSPAMRDAMREVSKPRYIPQPGGTFLRVVPKFATMADMLAAAEKYIEDPDAQRL